MFVCVCVAVVVVVVWLVLFDLFVVVVAFVSM